MIIRLLILAQHVFMLWMLIDAIRRKADGYWYLIIFIPLGEWVYFFSIKIHDPQFQRFKQMFFPKNRPSLKELRYRANESPTIENRCTLAQALNHAGEYSDAAEIFSEILSREPSDCPARYGLGTAKAGLQDYEGAVEILERLVAQNPSYNDYGGWLQLVDAYWKINRREKALQCARELVKTSPRTNHKVTMAFYLRELGHPQEARSMLVETLEEYEYSPAFVKRSYRTWAKRAKHMLRELSAAAAAEN